MNSVERVKAICKERGIPISKLERDLGFSNAYIGQLKKGTFPAERLSMIADYLKVTTEYLLTGQEKPAPCNGDGLDQETGKLVKMFSDAAPKVRELAMAVLEGKEAKSDYVKVKITCPIDGSEQVIFQPVYRIGGVVIPEKGNNGCEMCHPCQECTICRLRAAASVLPDFEEKEQ